MVLIPRASLSFKRSKPQVKVSFANTVISSISPVAQLQKINVTLTDLPVPVADLQDVNDRLSNAITQAGSGNHAAISDVKTISKEWSEKFGLTADYFTSVARTSENPVGVIRLAGFTPTKTETTPRVQPGPINNFFVTINGTKGAIIAGGKKAASAAIANVFAAVPAGVTISFSNNTMIITAGDKKIFINVDTQKQTKMYGLNSAEPYNVCSYAVNSKGNGPVSAMMEIVPQ
jgi:hypothetical protein